MKTNTPRHTLIALLAALTAGAGFAAPPRVEPAPPVDKDLPTLQALLEEDIITDPAGDYLGVYQAGQAYPGNPDLDWDTFFTDPSHWKDLPEGNWRLESRTATELKYTATNEEQTFMGTPVTRARIRVSTKTGQVTGAEILWVGLGSVGGVKPFVADIPSKKKDRRKLFETVQDDLENDRATMIYERDKVAAELGKRFPKQKAQTVGTSALLRAKVTDYETPTGLNIRFWKEDQAVVFAIIQPIAEVTNKFNTAANKPKTSTAAWAKSNVAQLPKGDVIIKNLPMVEQGNLVACGNAARAMVFEYWGLITPIELCNAKANFQPKGAAQDIWEPCAKEGGLKTGESQLSLRAITREIDAGRPVIIKRNVNNERTALHLQWREDVAADPDFQIPNPKLQSEQKQWITAASIGHVSVITGYNSRRKEFLLTDSWGEGCRQARISYDELAATAQAPILYTTAP